MKLIELGNRRGWSVEERIGKGDWGFPGGSGRNLGSFPGSRRSPGEGNGTPLRYSCLGNLMDRRAWWATVHGLTKE